MTVLDRFQIRLRLHRCLQMWRKVAEFLHNSCARVLFYCKCASGLMPVKCSCVLYLHARSHGVNTFTTHECGVVIVSDTSVCVLLCTVWAVTFECLVTYKRYFWYAGTSSEYLGQGRVSRSWGQGHTIITKYTFLWMVCLRLKGGLILFSLEFDQLRLVGEKSAHYIVISVYKCTVYLILVYM